MSGKIIFLHIFIYFAIVETMKILIEEKWTD